MIQENSSTSNNSCYVQATDMPISQHVSFVSIEDQSGNLLNGRSFTLDIQSFDQQQQQPQQIVLNEQTFQTVGQVYYMEDVQQEQQTNMQEQQCSFYTNGIENPPTPEGTPIMDNNMGDISDASTIEGGNLTSDEPYAFLQELNSDNLMQFSQQSDLQKMLIRDQFSGKTNQNTLPVFEEHDIGNYNFKLNIPTQQNKGKTSWIYSEEMNKLFIRMNDIFNIEVRYTPQMPVQQLRLRTFLCFVKDVCEPVLRCQNHLSKDNETHITKRESLLRCENPDAEYSGSSNGKSIKERYSITVPLSMCVMQNDNSVKQAIALKFTCQNSCIGRKETRLIFVLEGMNGEILSQRLVNVRICSCPKRDKGHEEKNLAKKRKTDNGTFESDAKIRKRESTSPDSSIIKDENSCSDYENAAKQYDIQRTASGGFRLVMELSSKENALSIIKSAYANECVNIVNGSKDAARSRKCYNKLKRLYDTCDAFC